MTIDMTRKLPRPTGHHSITPGVAVVNAAKVIGFLERAFGGKVVDRYEGPGGVVHHAEVLIGDSVVMLGEAQRGADTTTASLSYYVDTGEAVDRTYQRALDNGALSLTEPANQFYGYRSACVRDPGGTKWTICAIVEDLTRDELDRRAAAAMKP